MNLDMTDSIKEYLKENLTISVYQETVFGPEETIKVVLELDGEVISEDSCSLPE